MRYTTRIFISDDDVLLVADGRRVRTTGRGAVDELTQKSGSVDR